MEEQLQEIDENNVKKDRKSGKERHCNRSGKTEHNVRTYQEDIEMIGKWDSEQLN